MDRYSYVDENQAELDNLLESMYRFRDERKAFKFAEKCTIRNLVVRGDDDRFWVGMPAQTERLAHMGYRYIS